MDNKRVPAMEFMTLSLFETSKIHEAIVKAKSRIATAEAAFWKAREELVAAQGALNVALGDLESHIDEAQERAKLVGAQRIEFVIMTECNESNEEMAG